jgi:hypothetical protein
MLLLVPDRDRGVMITLMQWQQTTQYFGTRCWLALAQDSYHAEVAVVVCFKRKRSVPATEREAPTTAGGVTKIDPNSSLNSLKDLCEPSLHKDGVSVRAIQTPKNLLVTFFSGRKKTSGIEISSLRQGFESSVKEITWQITIQRDSHFMLRGSFFLLDSSPPWT